MTEPDYEAFYDAIIGIAEGLQSLTEDAEELSERERNIMKVIVENIVFAAEEHVPGGWHTEVFDINHKEDEA